MSHEIKRYPMAFAVVIAGAISEVRKARSEGTGGVEEQGKPSRGRP
jgi:hypothetical protein